MIALLGGALTLSAPALACECDAAVSAELLTADVLSPEARPVVFAQLADGAEAEWSDDDGATWSTADVEHHEMSDHSAFHIGPAGGAWPVGGRVDLLITVHGSPEPVELDATFTVHGEDDWQAPDGGRFVTSDDGTESERVVTDADEECGGGDTFTAWVSAVDDEPADGGFGTAAYIEVKLTTDAALLDDPLTPGDVLLRFPSEGSTAAYTWGDGPCDGWFDPDPQATYYARSRGVDLSGNDTTWGAARTFSPDGSLCAGCSAGPVGGGLAAALLGLLGLARRRR